MVRGNPRALFSLDCETSSDLLRVCWLPGPGPSPCHGQPQPAPPELHQMSAAVFPTIQTRQPRVRGVGAWSAVTRPAGPGAGEGTRANPASGSVLACPCTETPAASPGVCVQGLGNARARCLLLPLRTERHLSHLPATEPTSACTVQVLSFSPGRVCWKISSLPLESKYEIIVYFSLDLFAFLLLKSPFERRGLLENKGTLLNKSEANFYFGRNGNKVNITIA